MNPKKGLIHISRKYKLSLIVLFGSYATGKVHNKSDKDIAVWTRKDNINELKLFYDFLNLYNSGNIDLLLLNRADPLTQYEVAVKGKPLYEDEDGRFRQFQIYAMKRNDDGKKFYNLDKLYIKRFLKKGKNIYERYRYNPPKIGKDGRISWEVTTDYKG